MAKLSLENNFSASSFQNISSDELMSTGYKAEPFSGRLEQMEEVMDSLANTGFIPEQFVESETRWFYESLGIDDVYFARESVSGIVSHILALYSAKVDAFARGVNDKPFLHHKREADDHAVYFDTGNQESFQERVDDKYLDNSGTDSVYRTESFYSPFDQENNVKCQFVYRCQFPQVEGVDSQTTALDLIGDTTFMRIASPHTKMLYGEVISEAVRATGPIIKHFNLPHSAEHRVIIGYRQKTSPRYNSALSALCDYYKLKITRRYVEQFANGVSVVSMYITPSDEHDTVQSDVSIHQLIKEASLLYSIPNNMFYNHFVKGEMSLQECIYAHCGVIFVTHFLNRLGPEYHSLKSLLDPTKSVAHAEVLNRLKERLRSETFTESYILETFQAQKSIVQQLYRQFADIHYPHSRLEQTLSYQRLTQIAPIENEEQFERLLQRSCAPNEHHMLVLRALYAFNNAVLKTNFFTSTKVAISFRLESSFLPLTEYPNKPFGMFFVVGSDFRGFHIRFRDIARGGIRIVKSRSPDAYFSNMRNLFDENYNLASTQQRKNKDIPEGGSKGVILLNMGNAQNAPQASFTKYIDSILDLLIQGTVPGVKDPIVDLYRQPEILFMGPDENTAGYVDWATEHARLRGAPWWRSFFTGKSPTLGGIPHDEYGMTSLSVRAFVEKIYEKLLIQSCSVSKLQTGGPDGDLGSNEILLSRDEKYVAIVDGSGVIVDPRGLDKTELLRLAESRMMVGDFNTGKLSSEGYFISINDTDFPLPNGQVVTSGVAFRNTFHLKAKELFGMNGIQLFVPCGGRPNAIDTSNVSELIDEKTGKCVIPYIVEGANLFITQAAKLQLEKAGCILFKDASTNKGGVTSSSLEVLSALCFDDEGFLENMCINSVTGEKPQFYQKYVKQVQATVVEKAQLEFEMLWKLKQQTDKPFSILSDELSVAINQLADDLAQSKELWDEDVPFRNAVLVDSLPPLLLEKIGIEQILERVPTNYLKALFATRLASEFVYTRGIEASAARFLEYISSIRKKM